MPLSVILPTLNEEDWLESTVSTLRANLSSEAPPPTELIVADSGSRDGTVPLARRLGARVVEPPPGGLPSRAAACNRGAAEATGTNLLFLDADCRLPSAWNRHVATALADPGVVAGAFHLALDGPERGLRRVEQINRLRYRTTHLFYGDQALFVRTADFHVAGGFPEVPVLESALLCRALKRRGRLTLVNAPVLASARRFHTHGILRVFLLDLWIWTRWNLRFGPGRAGRRYWQENRRRGERSNG